MSPEEKRQTMLEKIRALLSKAEHTNFPEEAKVFTEKAQELMTRYALSEAELDVLGRKDAPDEVITKTIVVECPYTVAKGSLVSAVAKGNGCKVVFAGNDHRVPHPKWPDGLLVRNIYVTGFSKDIELVELVFTSLLIQAQREQLNTPRPSHVSARVWNKSFLLGYAAEIGARLRNRKKAVINDMPEAERANVLPVLMSKEQQVQQAVEQRWGRLGKISVGQVNDGYSAGRSAATRADVGNARIGGRKALPR